MSSQALLGDLCRNLLAQVELRHSLWLRIERVRVRIDTNDEELHAKLQRYFGVLCYPQSSADAHADIHIHAVQAPEPSLPNGFGDWPRDGGKVGRKEAFLDFPDGRIVRKVRTRMHFLLQKEVLLAIGPCRENDNQVINFVNAQYVALQLRQGYQLCHAAGVSILDQGLAIAARAGAGKSTLALHLMSRGLDFVSNDRLLLRDLGSAPEMAGIPKMPRVNPGTLLNNPDLGGILPARRVATLRELPKKELWQLEEKYDVMVDSVYGKDRSRFHAKLCGVLLLNWSPEAREPTEIEQVDISKRPDLLQLLMKSPGVFHRDASGRPAPAGLPLDASAYLHHLRNVPVYEARGYAHFEAAIPFCCGLLEGERSPGR